MPDTMRDRMHEKLDGVLAEDLTDELYRFLAKDDDAAREYARLENVDTLLATAPSMRAPQRLAVTIMARLAQQVEMQAAIQSLPQELRASIMQSLSLSMVASMPLMVGASWVVLNAMGDPELLTSVIERVITTMVLMVDAQIVLLNEIEPYLQNDPQFAAACLRLIPSMMEGLLDSLEGK